MAVRTMIQKVPKEVSIYVCDHCHGDIGPAPIQKHGGYFMVCSVAPESDKKPLWMATLCAACMDELAGWADGRPLRVPR